MSWWSKQPARTRGMVYLLGALVAYAGWQGLGGGSTAPIGSTVGTPGPGRGRGGGIPDEIVALRLADLEQQAGAFELGRDPFRFGVKPPPPPPPRREPPPPPPRVEAPPPPPCPPNCPKPQPPPVPFTYLGSFGPPARQIAVLKDGSELFNALEGDVLKGEFRVTKIGLESVDIDFVNFPDARAQRLPVAGGKAGR